MTDRDEILSMASESNVLASYEGDPENLVNFFRLAQAAAYERAAALYGIGDVAAPIGHSAWGETIHEGWILGTQAYRDAILALNEEK